MRAIQRIYSTEYDKLNIYPLADAHIGDRYADIKAIKAYIKKIQEDDNGAVIINGDILNLAVRHSVSDIYSETCNPQDAIDFTCGLLEPIADKILVITEGNHEMRAWKDIGITIMSQVATRLGIPDVYCTGAYILFVTLGISQYAKSPRADTGKQRQITYAIYGKHGAGGGRKKGAKTIRLDEMAEVCDADIFLHSHTHLPLSFRDAFFRVDYQNKSIQEIDQLFINTNAWLKYGGYGEEKGYSPTSRIPPLIILSGKEKLARCLV